MSTDDGMLQYLRGAAALLIVLACGPLAAADLEAGGRIFADGSLFKGW
jgi:hypothetical protein